MPKHTEETKIESMNSIASLIKAGVPENFMYNSITSGRILSDAVDFIKKLGALTEFMESLKVNDRLFLLNLFKIRPKYLGGNPFE